MTHRNFTGIRRRQVLAGLACLASVPASRAAMPVHVVVVGAGLAGLSAAHLLRQQGARVSVLEARPRPGGRVQTVSTGAGLHGELGAARIADSHSYVMRWLGEFGLEIEPFMETDLAAVFSFEGKRYHMQELAQDAAIARRLAPKERGLTPPQLLARYMADIPPALQTPSPDETEWSAWRGYDAVTWPAFLKKRGASDEAVKLMVIGNDAKNASALYVLRQIMLHRNVRRYYRIKGGNALLPQKFAQSLGETVRYNARVNSIEKRNTGLRVYYERQGRHEALDADRVLVTVPFSVLKTIKIDAPLSQAKRRAIAGLPYRGVTRALLDTRKPFWRDNKESGWARTDAPAEIWDDGFGQSGGGLLSLTLSGPPDAAFAGLNHDARVARSVVLASAAFPALRLQFQRGTVHRWSDEPYSKGAFAEFYPGQMTTMFPGIGTREERIHFAGEHTSSWMGWMEGALESGERAVREITGI